MKHPPPSSALTDESVQWMWITLPSRSEAESLAKQLLEKHLAACVNIIPGITSYYRWQGRICCDEEVVMVVKTSSSVVEACQRTVIELHGADLPGLLRFEPAGGFPPFIDWIKAQVLPAVDERP